MSSLADEMCNSSPHCTAGTRTNKPSPPATHTQTYFYSCCRLLCFFANQINMFTRWPHVFLGHVINPGWTCGGKQQSLWIGVSIYTEACASKRGQHFDHRLIKQWAWKHKLHIFLIKVPNTACYIYLSHMMKPKSLPPVLQIPCPTFDPLRPEPHVSAWRDSICCSEGGLWCDQGCRPRCRFHCGSLQLHRE